MVENHYIVEHTICDKFTVNEIKTYEQNISLPYNKIHRYTFVEMQMCILSPLSSLFDIKTALRVSPHARSLRGFSFDENLYCLHSMWKNLTKLIFLRKKKNLQKLTFSNPKGLTFQ